MLSVKCPRNRQSLLISLMNKFNIPIQNAKDQPQSLNNVFSKILLTQQIFCLAMPPLIRLRLINYLRFLSTLILHGHGSNPQNAIHAPEMVIPANQIPAPPWIKLLIALTLVTLAKKLKNAAALTILLKDFRSPGCSSTLN